MLLRRSSAGPDHVLVREARIQVSLRPELKVELGTGREDRRQRGFRPGDGKESLDQMLGERLERVARNGLDRKAVLFKESLRRRETDQRDVVAAVLLMFHAVKLFSAKKCAVRVVY